MGLETQPINFQKDLLLNQAFKNEDKRLGQIKRLKREGGLLESPACYQTLATEGSETISR